MDAGNPSMGDWLSDSADSKELKIMIYWPSTRHSSLKTDMKFLVSRGDPSC